MIFDFFEKNEHSFTQCNFKIFQIHSSMNDGKIFYFLDDFDKK